MIEYEAVRQRMRELEQSGARQRRAMEARRPVREALGTHLARLGLRLAGPGAVWGVLGEAR